MSKLIQLPVEVRHAYSSDVYKRIKEEKIDFRIKNMTVMFTNPKQLDKLFYSCLSLFDTNELLRLCSQEVN